MKQTPLYNSHIEQGGKMVEFASYSMPIQYSMGIIEEHKWTRDSCGIFDVSHMGQLFVKGDKAAQFLSFITPTDFTALQIGRCHYTVLTNEKGGIIDDLIITKFGQDEFFIVINAACREKDISHMKSMANGDVEFDIMENKSLIAIQGPKAQQVLQQLTMDDLSLLPYMNAIKTKLKSGDKVIISRTGYTGEDGFEISTTNPVDLWQSLLQDSNVRPIGLGARDTLRLEMGYPLYGHDLNDETTPIEAGLAWVISKTNTNFIGSSVILKQVGVTRKRVGIKLLDKGIMREGYKLYNAAEEEIGNLTSGGFSPSLGVSIGLAYIPIGEIAENNIFVDIRGKKCKAIVVRPSFMKAKTY